jgi:hypothetical protein
LSPEHGELLTQLRQASRPTSAERHQSDSYGGSGHLFYFVSAPDRRAIAKAWVASHRSTTPQTVLAVVDSLVDGQSHEEKTLGALLLGCHAPARAAVRPADLDRWLGKLNGWAEIDCQCHNLFSAAQMLADWPAWKSSSSRRTGTSTSAALRWCCSTVRFATPTTSGSPTSRWPSSNG